MNYGDMLGLNQLEPAIFKVALAIESGAVNLAPVADIDGGGLRNSIMVATELRDEGFNSRGGERAPDDAKIESPERNDGGTAYVGTGIVYGAAVEFGRPDMLNYPAQPYLRPAAMLVKAKLDGTFTKELRNSIKKWTNDQRYIQRQNGIERTLKYEQGGIE